MFLDALEVFILHLGVDILSHHSFAAFIVEYKYTNPLEELPYTLSITSISTVHKLSDGGP
jgi:hypothetical protein